MSRGPWYGDDPEWYSPFDAEAFGSLGRHLSVQRASRMLTYGDAAAVRMDCGHVVPLGRLPLVYVEEPARVYRHDGIDVQGRTERVAVTVVFRPTRWYPGELRLLDGRNFPSVYAGQMDEAPHRFADGSLCLYYPRDPVQRRWTTQRGLRTLLSLAADHLFFEDVYRDTGEWIAPQAEHGFLAERGRAA